jgi:2-methylisocitrate lyase-like PEP mutase family enzyme
MSPGPSRARRLRDLLAGPAPVVAPGAYDALTSRLVERAGFPAVYVTGAGISYSTLGRPDLGLVSFAEMLERVGQAARAVSVPVIADADTGYGGPLNVIRTVQAYEAAGVSAVQIEDQGWPKRCGHLAQKTLVPAEEMAAKVEAACWARRDPGTLVIARTDARSVEGLDAALARAQRYAAAGAELIFVESPESVEELARVAREVPAPVMANMVEGGRTPLTDAGTLGRLGYRLVIFPNLLTRVMARAGLDALAVLGREGSSAGLLDRLLSFPELNAFLGLDELNDIADRFQTRREP